MVGLYANPYISLPSRHLVLRQPVMRRLRGRYLFLFPRRHVSFCVYHLPRRAAFSFRGFYVRCPVSQWILRPAFIFAVPALRCWQLWLQLRPVPVLAVSLGHILQLDWRDFVLGLLAVRRGIPGWRGELLWALQLCRLQ